MIQAPSWAAARMRGRPFRLSAAVIFVALLAIGVMALLIRLQSAVPLNSDQSGVVLAGHDLLHGNGLLAGWIFPSDSFITSRIPLVAVLELIHGFNYAEVDESAAIMGAFTVICGAWLARRGEPSRGAWLGALLTFSLLLAPIYLRDGTQLLPYGSNHAGTLALLLLGLVILDRAPDAFPAQAGFAVMLGLAAAGDPTAFWIGGAAVALVSVLSLVTRTSLWQTELRLLALTGGCLIVARESLVVINAAGGFYHQATTTDFVAISELPSRAIPLVHDVLDVFGADVLSVASRADWMGWVHLAGVFMVMLGAIFAIRRWLHLELDRISQLLLAGMAADLAAVSVSSIGLNFTRYLLIFMAFGATLAGRVACPYLIRLRMPWLPVAVSAVYMAGTLWTALSLQPAVLPNQEAQTWLVANGYTYGLGQYWAASVLTVASGEQVTVRPIVATNGVVRRFALNSQQSWYDSSLAQAHFVIYPANPSEVTSDLDTSDTGSQAVDPNVLLARFGPPVDKMTFGPMVVMTWRQNLLDFVEG